MPSLSVIIPTTGRASLEAAMRSCEGADQVIVIENQDGDNGYAARTRGMAQATGTHLAFLDDDDVYTPGAIDRMRAAACESPVIFRMDHPQHGILWRTQELVFGNVGTPMFLVPNSPEKLGRWEPHIPGLREPGGDYTFIRGCVEQMGEPVWRDEVVATIRPDFQTVAIVTPWLDHPELLPDYREAVSVRSHRDELIVVDNGSTPPVNLPGVRLEGNHGFAKACNAGLDAASTEIVLFLNNDVAVTGADWLERLRSAVEPGVLVGANIRGGQHGMVDGHPFPYLDGWCLAGARDDILDLGGFDETFEEPSYYGDNDLCLRARLMGMTLREVSLPLVHKGNATAGPGTDPGVAAVTERNYRRFAERARQTLEVAA